MHKIFDIITIMPFGWFFCILFVPNYSNIYEGRHLNELCAYLSIKFQVMYA